MIRSLPALPCLLLTLAACTDDDPAPLAAVSLMAPSTGAVDAALSPDGTVGFYAGHDGAAAIVGTIDAGGARVVLRGAPLQSARGLVAADADTVYVADELGDAVYRVDGGVATRLAPTAGTHPRVVELDDAGTLYWAGLDGDDAAIFALTGDGRRVVARDPRFTSIGGLDVADDGTVYVADDSGTVFRVAGASVTVLAEGLTLGDPAGVALTGDGATLLVSALDATGHSQVVLLDTATGARSTFHDVIGASTGSGGLHRAQDAVDQLIWVDLSAGTAGTVYRVKLN